jgi:hypothetical protein
MNMQNKEALKFMQSYQADLASIVQKASQPASLPVKQLPPESPPVAIQPVPAAPGAQPPFPGDLAPAVPVPSANPGNAASSGGLAKVEQPPAPPLTPVLPAAVSPPVAPKVVEAPSVSPANAVMSPPVPSAAPVSSPSVPMAKEPVKVGDALPKPAGSDASAKLVEQRLLQVEKRIDALTAQLSGLSTQMQMQPTSQAKQVQTVAAKPAGKSDLPVMEISLKSLGVDKILDDGVVLSRNQEPASIGDAVKEFGGARLVRVDPKAGLIVTDRKMYKIK